MPLLEINTGTCAGRRYELCIHRETVLGRDPTCDVVLVNASISRRHARIVPHGDEFQIEDLGSVNGTFVNGIPAHHPADLRDGDRIQLHDLCFVFHTADNVSENTSQRFGISQPATSEAQSVERATATVTAPNRIVPQVPSVAPVADTAAEFEVPFDTDLAISAVIETPPEYLALRVEAQLRSIAQIHQQLSGRFDIDDVLPTVLDLLFEAFPQALNGRILLIDERHQLLPRAVKQCREDDSAVFTIEPASDPMLLEVMATGETIVVSHEDSASAIASDQLESVVAPIIGSAKRVWGIIQLELKPTGQQFEGSAATYLTTVCNATAQAIELMRTHKQLLNVDRRQHQLLFAREIQARMLPHDPPKIAQYAIADYYCPAYDVGGDFFGYYGMRDGSILIALGDVCGKGVSAALMMAQLTVEIRHALATAGSLKRVMWRLNRIAHKCQMQFVTLLMCLLNPARHTITVANAGHFPPICRRQIGGEVELLQPHHGSFPLGVKPQQEFHPQTFELNAGDIVLLFTDGVTDTTDVHGSPYGLKRLVNSLAGISTGPKPMIQFLLSSLRTFHRDQSQQDDDVCLVCLQRNKV